LGWWREYYRDREEGPFPSLPTVKFELLDENGKVYYAVKAALISKKGTGYEVHIFNV
jgi:hypothetical protein